MAGKITTVLTKREAETYCKQGLHKEALLLYRNLLASTPNIDPAFRSSFESQIDEISSTLDSDDLIEAHRLSAADIYRIKRGWGKNATESDILICAQAFFQIGRYREALKELAGMLRKGCAAKEATTLFASCLVRLQRPSIVEKNIEKLGKKIFDSPEKRFFFLVMLAQGMVSLNKPRYAQALLENLRKYPSPLREKASRRLSAIVESIGQGNTAKGKEAPAKNDPPPKGPLPPRQAGQSPANEASLPKGKTGTLFRWLSRFSKYTP